MATKNEIRGMLRRKARANLLPPPWCASCKADLRDHQVPAEHAAYAAMFGYAIEVRLADGSGAWRCPHCDHVWAKHVLVDQQSRSR